MDGYNKKIRDFGPEDLQFENIIRNKRIFGLAKWLSVSSFIIANLIIIAIFEYVFKLIFEDYGIVLYLVGILFSFILIQTNLLLIFKFETAEPETNDEKEKNQDTKKTLDTNIPEDLEKKESNQSDKSNNNEQKNDVKKPKLIKKIQNIIIKIWNYFLMISHFIFFNIFNDMFFLTFFWTVFFGFFYSIFLRLGMFSLPLGFDFFEFLGLITMISLMSGFFQLYIQRYKETVDELIQKNVNFYFQKNYDKIDPWDFLNFIKENQNYNELYNLISDIIEKDNLKKLMHSANTFVTKRNRNDVLVFNLQSPATNDPITLFNNLEHIIQNENSDHINDFENALGEYFDYKFKQFSKKLSETDFSNIRKIIFSNINFFEECYFSYIDLNFKSGSVIEEPNNFEESYYKHFNNCFLKFFDVVISEVFI